MTVCPGRVFGPPRAHDGARAAAAAEILGDCRAAIIDPSVIVGAAGSSPFLARLIQREAAWLGTVATSPPSAALDDLMAEVRAEAAGGDKAAVMRVLRRLRARAALLIALADLAGVATLGETTAALSALARTALDITIDHLMAGARLPDRLPGVDGHGYVVIGMGKLGASELNFSSDIDLICLFDQDLYPPDEEAEARRALIRLTRGLVEILSTQNADGYVFRTDLRLRPNPSSLPVCLSMAGAERYYEAEGRTWERAAHVKASAVAGDCAAGQAYLDRLAPFIWRRSLDFYALDEVQGLLGQISSQAGSFALPAAEQVAGVDIKRTPGGIREIELFVQTRQLILGGRNPRLRQRGTLDALAALTAEGAIPDAAARQLAADYTAHRDLEHRLQMVEDAQTHSMPVGEDARERLAALCGAPDARTLEADLAARLRRVHETVAETLAPPSQARPGDAAPSGTESALTAAGFERPAEAAAMLERWRGGLVAATRAPRARSLFERIEGRLISGLAAAAHPDDALIAFGRFIDGLPAGVQVFSLLAANPGLLAVLVEVVAASPRLARYLSRHPAALEALIARDFFGPPMDRDAAIASLGEELDGTPDLERALDRTRAWAREQHFRVSVQVLRGRLAPARAGSAFAAIADACLFRLSPRVAADLATRHGLAPGRGMVVLALGKLGTEEMTAGSDLDLITVYDAAGQEQSTGPRPLAPSAYYPRLTKALLSALTVPTAEGRLYEVDMRLRPSGRSGPVSVSLESFIRYHASEAEVWEHMALSRARIVARIAGERGTAGAEGLAADVRDVIDSTLAARATAPRQTAEAAAAMRQRLIEAHTADRTTAWALKHAAGGVMEIEFLAQTGGLMHALGAPRQASALLPDLAAAGWLEGADAARLAETLDLLLGLQQVERAALERSVPADQFGAGLQAALCRAAALPDFGTLEARLSEAERAAAEIARSRFATLVQDAGDEGLSGR
ncbi:MAG: bifunctional [glutamine synthetase] adenylyltransferase/[glutamine synthetase]-adenylyl-L-tyrosine phosphorylase [Pseudomonadota bacterium]